MISTFTFLLVFAAQWIAFAFMTLFVWVIASDIRDVFRGDETVSRHEFKHNILIMLACMFVWSFLLLVGHSI